MRAHARVWVGSNRGDSPAAPPGPATRDPPRHGEENRTSPTVWGGTQPSTCDQQRQRRDGEIGGGLAAVAVAPTAPPKLGPSAALTTCEHAIVGQYMHGRGAARIVRGMQGRGRGWLTFVAEAAETSQRPSGHGDARGRWRRAIAPRHPGVGTCGTASCLLQTVKPLSWTGPKEHRAERVSTAHHACARVRYSFIVHDLSYRGPASCKRFIQPCTHTVMCALLMRAAVDTYFRNAVHACHRSMFMHARHTPANDKRGWDAVVSVDHTLGQSPFFSMAAELPVAPRTPRPDSE